MWKTHIPEKLDMIRQLDKSMDLCLRMDNIRPASISELTEIVLVGTAQIYTISFWYTDSLWR